MGDFRDFENERNSRPSGGRFDRRGGRGFGGRGGFGRDRRDMAPCDAVCAKCGKNCQVPFKPRGDKPVYCSACFGEQRDNAPRSTPSFSAPAPGVSIEQFQQLNKKLDKIIQILESLEIIEDEASPESVEEDPEEK